jgi:hypothetical protein
MYAQTLMSLAGDLGRRLAFNSSEKSGCYSYSSGYVMLLLPTHSFVSENSIQALIFLTLHVQKHELHCSRLRTIYIHT